jgi:hypothetical protein
MELFERQPAVVPVSLLPPCRSQDGVRFGGANTVLTAERRYRHVRILPNRGARKIEQRHRRIL